MVHNETVNVWTHVIGTLFFAAMINFVICYHQDVIYGQELQTQIWSMFDIKATLLRVVPVWPLLAHLVAALFQMCASAGYHLFMCKGYKCH